MLELLNGFVVELRNAGLPVSLTENLDAMEAVQHIPIDDREAFKYALGATLIKNHAHWRSFETVFEVYFSLRGPEYKLVQDGDDDTDIDELWRELQEQQQQEGSGGAGGLDSLTPEEIAQMLKVPMNEDRFFLEAHVKLRPVEFATEGVFVAGVAAGPKDIVDTIAEAGAADLAPHLDGAAVSGFRFRRELRRAPQQQDADHQLAGTFVMQCGGGYQFQRHHRTGKHH